MKSKVNVFLSLVFLFALLLIHPMYEWPDAAEQLQRSIDHVNFYPPLILINSSSVVPDLSNKHTFFSGSFMYEPVGWPIFENLFRAPFAIFFVIIIIYFFSLSGFRYSTFSPPLLFALAQPSQEALAIFVFVIGFSFIEIRKKFGLIILLLSAYLDRSMVPGVIFLSLYNYFPFAFRKIKKIIPALIICLTLVVLIKFVSLYGILGGLVPVDLLVYGISVDDLDYNSNYGARNIEALAASVMGLYGWMSIRPEPFIIYYLLVALVFLYGLKQSDDETRGFFFVSAMIPLITMWILPPLSQARYYPFLCIVFWRIIYNGVYSVSIDKRSLFNIFILSTTTVGLLSSFVS